MKETGQKDTVQSVDRALGILEVLSEYEEGLGITELSVKIELHKSTVHRLLGTLIHKGFVEQNEANKYKLTLKLFELGSRQIEKLDILKVARPHLRELMEKTNEVVHLVQREGAEIIYIDKVESENTIRMHSTIGKRSPMYCTAVGKAIMSPLSKTEVDQIWKQSHIQRFTEFTIVDLSTMEQELKTIREKGFSLDEQENELGVRCVGAAIFDYSGKPRWAISISGPTMRVTEEKAQEFAKLIIESSKKISQELGYRG